MKKRIIVSVSIWCLGFFLIFTGKADFLFSRTDVNFSREISAAGKSSSELHQEIRKKNEETESVKKEKEELLSEIEGMEKKKTDTVNYIKELDEKSNQLAEKMEKNRVSIRTLRTDIRALRKEKKETQKQKKNQYDKMKTRIKYIYESGSTGYLSLILGADSLSDFFNRTEYVEKVTHYDQTLLDRYQGICQKLEQEEKEIEASLTELQKKKDSLEVERSVVEELVDKKRTEVAEYQNLIQDKNDSLNHTEVLLSTQENDLEKLMEAERQASAREAAESEKEEREKKERQKREEEKKKQKSMLENTPLTTATKKPETAQIPTATPVKQPQSQTASGGYQWPLSVSGSISSYFGMRNAPTKGASSYHKGIDISVPVGTSVLATKAGTVITATYSSSAGNYVAVSHGGGVYSYYMHCSALKVSAGQSVSAGQQIALSGNSGISTGPHLHFGLYMGGSYVNPLSYVK